MNQFDLLSIDFLLPLKLSYSVSQKAALMSHELNALSKLLYFLKGLFLIGEAERLYFEFVLKVGCHFELKRFKIETGGPGLNAVVCNLKLLLFLISVQASSL